MQQALDLHTTPDCFVSPGSATIVAAKASARGPFGKDRVLGRPNLVTTFTSSK